MGLTARCGETVWSCLESLGKRIILKSGMKERESFKRAFHALPEKDAVFHSNNCTVHLLNFLLISFADHLYKLDSYEFIKIPLNERSLPSCSQAFIPFSFRKSFQIPVSPIISQGRSQQEYDWRVYIMFAIILSGLS